MNDIKIQKEALRAEAIRTRGLLGLNAADLENFERLFLQNIPLLPDSVVAAYWPKEREFDVRTLLDALLEMGVKVALPILQPDSMILKFAKWDHDTDLVLGKYGVSHPNTDMRTQYLEPDVVIVPLLAFDRKGGRLGYGGGYYDATLAELRDKKPITIVGVAYAEQACLFNLPMEEHDVKMDWVITQQQAHSF